MGGKILLLPVDTKSFFFSCSNGVRVPQWLSGKDLLSVQKLQETQTQSLGWEDPLEKGMATHSSTLA